MVTAKKIETVAQPGRRATLPLSLLDDGKFNPRKTFDEGKLDELAANIKQLGLLQPLVVRPSPTTKGRYDIAAGHRRRRACERAGLDDVDVVVRDLTDAEMILIGLSENGDREGLAPLEEAAGFAALREEGWTVEEIAAEIGKSVSLVQKRLRLNHLCDLAQQLMRDGKLSAAAAHSLCRLEDFDAQARVLKRFVEGGDAHEEITADEIEWSIDRELRRLANAPFDTTDTMLTTAGACTTCPKRTGAQPTFFPNAKTDDDACTDGACWARKEEAHGLVQLERVKKTAPQGVPVLIANDEDTEWQVYFTNNGKGPLRQNFIDLDSECDVDRERTWAQVLGDKAKPRVIVVAGDGTPLRIMAAVDAEKLLPPSKPAASSSSSFAGAGPKAPFVASTVDEERDMYDRNPSTWAKEDAALVAAVVARCERAFQHFPATAWLQLVLEFIVDKRGESNMKYVFRRRDVEVDIDFADWTSAMEGSELAGLIAEMLLPPPGQNFIAIANFAEELGIDVAAVRKKATGQDKKPTKVKAVPSKAKASSKKKPAKKTQTKGRKKR